MLLYNITELSQVTHQVYLITSRHIKCNLLGMIKLDKTRYQRVYGNSYLMPFWKSQSFCFIGQQ